MASGDTCFIKLHCFAECFKNRCNNKFNRYSLPLASDTNVFVRYYLDWLNQITALISHYIIIMVITLPVFYVGMCLYIAEMVNDLQRTVSMLDGATDTGTIAAGIIHEIRFHNELLE